MNSYLLFKSLHLIAVISWMAGLLYLPRIFVYHVENKEKKEATDVFESTGAWVLPVIDESGEFIGTLSKSMLFDRYRSELIVQTADHLE